MLSGFDGNAVDDNEAHLLPASLVLLLLLLLMCLVLLLLMQLLSHSQH